MPVTRAEVPAPTTTPTPAPAPAPAPRMLRSVPPTPGPHVLDDRQLMTLRMLADGLDTREIARSLCYSERTVKAVIGTVTARLGVRNRTHAVAHALRHGLI